MGWEGWIPLPVAHLCARGSPIVFSVVSFQRIFALYHHLPLVPSPSFLPAAFPSSRTSSRKDARKARRVQAEYNPKKRKPSGSTPALRQRISLSTIYRAYTPPTGTRGYLAYTLPCLSRCIQQQDPADASLDTDLEAVAIAFARTGLDRDPSIHPSDTITRLKPQA